MSRQIVFSLLLLAAIVAITGCNSGKATGLAAPGLTKEEVNQRHVESLRNDWWQIQDDIDSVFLFDRPGRLNRLSVR